MIHYENMIFYRDSSHNAVLFIIDSPTLFRDKKIHINNDFISLFFLSTSLLGASRSYFFLLLFLPSMKFPYILH